MSLGVARGKEMIVRTYLSQTWIMVKIDSRRRP